MDKRFVHAGLLAIVSGAADCYLSGELFDSGIAEEFFLHYRNLYEAFGTPGLYAMKGLLLGTLGAISYKNKRPEIMDAASLLNLVGIFSGVATYLYS
ncbi:hypothetical protein HN747_01725 [archaeon]|jgi:hypothetical protein|nr:hypothetical protein [archaeon]